MTFVLLVLSALGTAAALAAFQSGAAPDMAHYANARFAYSVDYPKRLLTPGGESSNGDGQRFASADGRITMLVWGQHNALERTIAAELSEQTALLQQERALQVSYKVARADWFAFSGTTGSRIVYQKTFLRDGIFKTLRLEYPVSEKATLDPAVRAIIASFRP